MNIKRKPFTNLNSFDDGDIAYRSSPDYLRNIFDQNALSSTDMISERNIPRTKTANELALKSNSKKSTKSKIIFLFRFISKAINKWKPSI